MVKVIITTKTPKFTKTLIEFFNVKNWFELEPQLEWARREEKDLVDWDRDGRFAIYKYEDGKEVTIQYEG